MANKNCVSCHISTKLSCRRDTCDILAEIWAQRSALIPGAAISSFKAKAAMKSVGIGALSRFTVRFLPSSVYFEHDYTEYLFFSDTYVINRVARDKGRFVCVFVYCRFWRDQILVAVVVVLTTRVEDLKRVGGVISKCHLFARFYNDLK